MLKWAKWKKGVIKKWQLKIIQQQQVATVH